MEKPRSALSTGLMTTAVFLGQAIGMAGSVSFPALQPFFAHLWSLSDVQSGFISGVYFAGYILAVPLLSALTDRIDPRRIYFSSLLFGAAAALGFALLSGGPASASLWRFLQGAAFGGSHMPGMRALSDAVPKQREARSVAIFTSTFTVGVSLSYALSGVLAEAFGWRLGFAFLSLGPLVAAGVAALVLPPLPRPVGAGASWLPSFKPLFRNRRALLFVCAYGFHNGEVSALRAWLVAILVFACDRAGRADLASYAALVAMFANLCATPLIILVNELAAKRERRRVIAATMAVSALGGLLLASAAAFSPYAAALAAILSITAATADSGTINAGLVAAAEPERRGAFLGIQALSGFGASALSPILFGFVLDLGGGSGREEAWIAAFALQASLNFLWPLFQFLTGKKERAQERSDPSS